LVWSNLGRGGQRVTDSATFGFSGPAVCRLTSVTYRQLDYWARTGLVTPSIRPATGSGSKRAYSYGDVLEVKVIKSLLSSGVSLPAHAKQLSVYDAHSAPISRRAVSFFRTRGPSSRTTTENSLTFCVGVKGFLTSFLSRRWSPTSRPPFANQNSLSRRRGPPRRDLFDAERRFPSSPSERGTYIRSTVCSSQ